MTAQSRSTLQEDRARRRHPLPGHLRELDPCGVPAGPRAHEPRLHPRCGPGRPGPPRRAARYRQLPRCHRYGGRALFRGEATARRLHDRLCGIAGLRGRDPLYRHRECSGDRGPARDSRDSSRSWLWVAIGQSMVAVRDWTFVLGTGVPALNAALLGWLMYRSRLVPRAIPVVGLIGAPLFPSWIIATPSASTTQAARGTPSRSSRSSCGSCRSASG